MTGPGTAATGADPASAPGVQEPADRYRSVRLRFWQSSQRAWDLAFYLVLAIGTASMAAAVPTGSTTAVRLAVPGVAICLLIAYLALGRAGARTGDLRLTYAYLAVMILLVGVAAGTNPAGGVLLFIGYSQLWYLSEHMLAGAVGSVALTGVVTAGFALRIRPQGAQEWVPLVGEMLVSLTFSLVIGLLVTRLAERSETTVELIADLEAAQERLAATHREAGVLAERERVAQEIHDTLAQGFTSIVLLAQGAAARLGTGDLEPARRDAAQLEEVAREYLADARALVAAFGPGALGDGTLAEALDRLTGRFAVETGVRVRVTVPEGDVDRDVQVRLLRGVQEVLLTARRDLDDADLMLCWDPAAGRVVRQPRTDATGTGPVEPTS